MPVPSSPPRRKKGNIEYTRSLAKLYRSYTTASENSSDSDVVISNICSCCSEGEYCFQSISCMYSYDNGDFRDQGNFSTDTINPIRHTSPDLTVDMIDGVRSSSSSVKPP